MSLTLLPNNAMTFAENQHATAVLEKLKQQRELLRCCDVILYVAGEKYHAHRCVLSACSPFFDSLFKAGKVVKEQLNISSDSPDVFQCLLTYMYTGTVIVDTKNVAELLRLANKLLLFKLKDRCAEYLERYLDVQNCLTVLEMANKYDLESLKATVTKLISTYLFQVIQGKEILELCPAKIEKFITNPDWPLSEVDKLELITSWVDHKREFRENNLYALLTFISWDKVTFSSIKKIFTRHPLYNSHKSLYFLLKMLNEQNLLPQQYKDYLKTMSTDAEYNSDQVLKMAVSTAIEEISDPMLLKDKVPPLCDALPKDDFLSTVDPSCQHLGGVNNSSPKFDNLLELEPTLPKTINNSGLFDGCANEANYEVGPSSDGRNYSKNLFSDLEPSTFENLPPVLNLENNTSHVPYSDKRSPTFQDENRKFFTHADYHQGINMTLKSFSSISTVDQLLDMDGSERIQRNSFQEPLKQLSFEDPNWHRLAQYPNNQLNPDFLSHRTSLDLSLVNATSPPSNIGGCDLDKEIRNLKQMNPDDEEQMIQAFQEDIGVGQDNPIPNNSEIEGSRINNINSVLFSVDYPLECSEEVQSQGSPHDMTLPHLKLDHNDPAFEKNLEALISKPATLDSDRTFQVVDAPNLEPENIQSYGKLKKIRRMLEEKQKSPSEVKQPGPFAADDNLPDQIKVVQKPRKQKLETGKKKADRKCEICDSIYSTSKEYFGHMKQHFPGPPHRCNKCESVFNRIYHLLDHLHIHSDEKPYKCQHCDFSTRKLCNLKEHQILHDQNLKPFKCTQCSSSFTRKQFLEQHISKHSQDRPFVCENCGWTGKTQNSLYLHSKIHKGDLYRCQYPDCPYQTPKKSHLNEHLQSHSKSRSFTCSFCSKGFLTSSHLKRHMKKHDSVNLKSCSLCDFSSTRMDLIKSHIKRMHSEDRNKDPVPHRKCKLRKKDAMHSNNASSSSFLANNQSMEPNICSEEPQQLLSNTLFDNYSTFMPSSYSLEPSDGHLDSTSLTNNDQQISLHNQHSLPF